MDNSITIRDARPSDYESLCAIFAQANDHHRELRPDYYREVRPIISKKDFYLAAFAQRFEFGRKRVCVKIAEQNGENIGAAFAVSVKRRDLGWSKYDKEACLDNIYVDKSRRRRGVGTALLNAVTDWAKSTGHEYLYAKIVNDNDASKTFFTAGGCQTTDVIMAAPLA